MGKQLSVMASHVCHSSQYGGLASRSIDGAFAHPEHLALQASHDSRFSLYGPSARLSFVYGVICYWPRSLDKAWRSTERRHRFFPWAISLDEFLDALVSMLLAGGMFSDVRVVDEMQWLGMSLSRGSFQPHRYAVDKIVKRGEIMRHSTAGSAGNLYIANLAILSTFSLLRVTHTSSMRGQRYELQRAWNQCLRLVSVLILGHSQFLPGCLPRLRDLFGLPCNVPLIKQIQTESQLKVIEKLRFDPRVLLANLGGGFDPWLADAIHGWRTGGCLASWTHTLQRAQELGIACVRRVGALTDTFVNVTNWLSVRRSLNQRTVSEAK
eukprot:3910049-Amphidinium_carterae.4